MKLLLLFSISNYSVVPLPMTIEEFQRGQIFSRAKRDEADCLNGEFSFTVKNEFRSHEKLGNVLFTERINYISKKLPNALKSIFTSLKEAKAIEKTFDNFPFVIDEYENQPFADSLKVSAQTFHKDDRGNSDPKTMFNLSSEEMKILQIINLNISKVNKKKKLKSFRPIFEGWIVFHNQIKITVDLANQLLKITI
ncbi:hypothetical protein MHBO_002807 [Bonamia ostreae]|uniref:Phosphatidylinositol transfer protein N-terminal domain-containing protein n=1 Tax=Bonamia ostreae TaxID=126728 RepID=A0ABV2ANL0_9EUKA